MSNKALPTVEAELGRQTFSPLTSRISARTQVQPIGKCLPGTWNLKGLGVGEALFRAVVLKLRVGHC